MALMNLDLPVISSGGSHPHQNGQNDMRFSLFHKFITLYSPWLVLAFPLPPRLASFGRTSVKIVYNILRHSRGTG